MSLKILGYVLLAAAFMLSCWYFFWPLVECSYAMSWEPLLENTWKLILFLFGGMVFVIGFIFGVRFII